MSFSQKSQWSLCLCAFILLAEGRVPCFIAPSVYMVLHAKISWTPWENFLELSWFHRSHGSIFFIFFYYSHTRLKHQCDLIFHHTLITNPCFVCRSTNHFEFGFSSFFFCSFVDIHDMRIGCGGILQQQQNADWMREPMRSTQRTKWTYQYGRKYISCYRK